MNTTTSTYKEIFKEQERNLGSLTNTAIHQQKLDAFDSFDKLGFPTRKSEEWKYTNVASFTRASLNPQFFPTAHTHIKKKDFRYYENIQANKVVFINGSYQEHLSEILEQDDNIIIKSFNKAIDENKEVFEQYFNTIARNESDVFTALNTSMFGDGFFVHVKKNTKLQYPILWIFLSNDNSNCIINPRNLIIIEEGAEVEIIEDYQGISETDYFMNPVSEIFLEKNSKLDLTIIQNETAHGLHYIGTNEIMQKAFSNLKCSIISLSGKLIRNNIHTTLSESGAYASISGVYFGKDQDMIDNHLLIDHAAPHCDSHQLFKGIMNDSSNGVFNGKIFVKEHAIKTNAYQSNKNLLLSDKATVNTKPQLEIFADDVKCSHGATCGQLDENALFYLKARGLNEEMAKSLLMYAFTAEVFDSIKNEGIRKYMEEVFKQKLGLDM
jgi:Fe-S cluster assembly protein SufD